MNDITPFLARVLNEGTSALASYAAADLLSSRPEAEAGFVSDPFSGWKNWLQARLQEMSAAIGVGEPKIFAAQVQWAKGNLQVFSTDELISPESGDTLVALGLEDASY